MLETVYIDTVYKGYFAGQAFSEAVEVNQWGIAD